MSRKARSYHVEVKLPDGLGYRTIIGSYGTRQYCEGWVDAMDSLYPSAPHRIVSSYADGSIVVVRQTNGRSAVHTN